ncbi:TPA: Rap guanine nucleotide exchange factor-like 1 [Trebouxia sp. C0004]
MLANDHDKGLPVSLEARSGRTLEDMLHTAPHKRTSDDIEEIEHVLTKWSKYGLELPTPARLELCMYMGFASFAAGDTIFKQGEYGDHFYIILSGAVDVMVREGNTAEEEDKVVAHLLAGAAFGELALIQVPEFQGLPASTIESLAHVLTEKVFAPKAIIYHQGSEVEDVYFVQRGTVLMVRELEMDRKTCVLAGQTSSIPVWISGRKAVPAHNPGIKSATKGRKTFAKPPAGIKAGSAGKVHATGRLFCKLHGSECARSVSAYISVPFHRTGSTTDKSPPPGNHKLSLDVVKSLTGERPTGKPASRSGAGSKGNPSSSMGTRSSSRGALSSSKGQGSPLQRGDGQQKTTATLSAPQTSSADAAVISKGSVRDMGNLHTAAAAVCGSLQQSFLSPRKRQTTFSFEDVKKHILEPTASSNQGLLSEAKLTQSILQQMSYTGTHEARGHLFLEVDSLGKSEFFGEVSVTKSTFAPTTAVASNVTATVLVISKWDLMKRAPKELLDHITGRAQTSIIDDNAVREQYRECKIWQRYRQSVVNDVLRRSKAVKSNNPVNVWKGSFRDEAPIDRNRKPWKPNGLAASLYNTGSCGLISNA